MKRRSTVTLIAAAGLCVGILPMWTLIEGRAAGAEEANLERQAAIAGERGERAAERRQRVRARAEKAMEAQARRIDEIVRERPAQTTAPPAARSGGPGRSTPSFSPANRSIVIDGDLELGPLSNVSKSGYPWLWSDDAGNLGGGLMALGSTTYGTTDTAFGYYALSANTVGSNNAAFGAYALEDNIDGSFNSAFGANALSLNAGAGYNSAFGAVALANATTGSGNTAVGNAALYSCAPAGTTYPHGSFNTAVGSNTLFNNTTGLSNVAVGMNALFANIDSSFLTAVGRDALASNTTVVGPSYTYRGWGNTAVGYRALTDNTTGSYNTAVGNGSLESNLTGVANTAVGYRALEQNDNSGNAALGAQALQNSTSGYANTAVGYAALYANTTAYGNTAVGYYALTTSLGYHNIAVGNGAGSVTPPVGSYNILIGNSGVSYDNYVIRLGTQGTHMLTYVAGILGTPGPGGFYVHVTPTGQLVQGGPVPPSSRRFKREIRDMGEASSGLSELRPVTFEFTEKYERGRPGTRFGLIAEEVAEVFPHLVEYDAEGNPYTVDYKLLTPLLLNELQKQGRLLMRQGEEIARLRDEGRSVAAELRRLAQLEARLEALEGRPLLAASARARP